ncbi:MAG: Fe(3+) ABC transporter substrate-binding protein [Gammaproteobacteria bacterium]|nr:Fe(3+) ABC transporter substrate-binding protein [Gammaproteobacteria bacterium]
MKSRIPRTVSHFPSSRVRAARRWRLPLLASLLVGACQAGPREVVNVYSHRHYDADQLLFDRFEELTGIGVRVVTASADELITRLEREGETSPADLLITVDAGRLHRAKERGLLQPVGSPELSSVIPENLRDPEGYWFGLTQRARILAYAKDRVRPEELSTYEALAGPEWAGRVLARSSENIYNLSLLASMIAANGAEVAEEWAAGVVSNMARPPQGNDSDQVLDVAAGVGDVAIVNTYYVARLLNDGDPAARELASGVDVFFPNQDGRGAHVNVSGAGVTAHAPNAGNAVRLIEFLVSEEAQAVFAETIFEYPVRPGVPWAETLHSWGRFRPDPLNLQRLGELNSDAVMAFDRAGWR